MSGLPAFGGSLIDIFNMGLLRLDICWEIMDNLTMSLLTVKDSIYDTRTLDTDILISKYKRMRKLSLY